MERVRASIDNWPQRLKDCIAANGDHSRRSIESDNKTYITSRPFPIGVGRDHLFPLNSSYTLAGFGFRLSQASSRVPTRNPRDAIYKT
jgi:hypothetical protein